MSEAANPIMQITAGYGRITATWDNDYAIWVSDYYAHQDPHIETIQLTRRTDALLHRFKRYKLLDPVVEILDTDVIDADAGGACETSSAGGQLLRVTTLLMPYVDPGSLRPIVELRVPAPTVDAVREQLVANGLRAGGQAIYDTFGSAMHERRPTPGNAA
jgi:hypothetical protein